MWGHIIKPTYQQTEFRKTLTLKHTITYSLLHNQHTKKPLFYCMYCLQTYKQRQQNNRPTTKQNTTKHYCSLIHISDIDMPCMSVILPVCQIGNNSQQNKQTQTPCRETPDRSLLKPDWRPQNDPRLDEYLKYHSSILPRLTIKFCYRIFLLIVILV